MTSVEREAPLVAIVVATRDRPSDLARLLPSVAAQTEPSFTCLVVDQSKAPGANAAAIAALDDARFVHLPTTTVGKSRALNVGLAATASPVIAFTDDDCTVPAAWLATALDAIATLGPRSLAFGSVTPADHDEDLEFVPAIAFDERKVFEAPLLRSPGLLGMGANMVATRDLFVGCGGFEEDLGPGGILFTGEDCELAYRTLRSGGAVLQTPALDLLHWGARPRAGDVARDLITTGFYAIGAGYGKHLRDRDWRAILVIIDETFATGREIVAAALHGRRPLHVRRLARFWKGVLDGFRRPLATPSIAPLINGRRQPSPAAPRGDGGA